MEHKFEHVGIQLTTECNRSCAHCLGDYGPNKPSLSLSKENVKRYIDQLPKHEVETLWLTGGEPTLYKDLSDILNYAKGKKEETGYPRKIAMNTNSSWADIEDMLKGEDTIRYLVSLKVSGLDEIYLSYDQFRTDKDRATVNTIYNMFAVKQQEGEEQEFYKNAMPEIKIQRNERIAPVGRGANLPKELWYKNHHDKSMCCALDRWAMYTWYQRHPDKKIKDDFKVAPVATVTPLGLSACSSLPDTIVVGKLGEDLSVIPERVQKLSDLFVLMSLESPAEAIKSLRKHINIPEIEDDCQICQHLFEKVDRIELERLCEDKTIEGALDEFRLERALAFGHS